MSEAVRRRWWRGVAVALVAGSAVAGAWVGFILPAAADPKHPVPTAPVPTDQTPWTRSADTPAAPPAPASDVVPASASVPAAPVPPAATTMVPAIPPVPATVPVAVPLPQPPESPRPLDASLLGSGPTPPPIPPLPAPTPAPIELPPPTPLAPTAPSATAIPPVAPVVPPAANLIPPPPAAKLPDPQQSVVPITPVAPDSGLPRTNSGNTVKPDKAGAGSGAPVPFEPPIIPPADQLKPVLPTPPPVAPITPTVPAIPAAGSPGEAPGTVVDRARPPESPFPAPNTTIPLHPAMTPGDSAMTKLNTAAAAAVLGGVLLAPTSQAGAFPPVAPIIPVPGAIAAQGQPDLKTVNDKLDEIQKQLKTISELLNGKKDASGFPLPSDPGIVAELKTLKDRLAAIDAELNKMKTQTSLRPPSAPPTVDPRAGKGTVRVVNEYPVQISIVVNGTSYRVAPNKTLDVDVPAGEFTYQLLEAGSGSTKSVIKEKETVTLRIK